MISRIREWLRSWHSRLERLEIMINRHMDQLRVHSGHLSSLREENDKLQRRLDGAMIMIRAHKAGAIFQVKGKNFEDLSVQDLREAADYFGDPALQQPRQVYEMLPGREIGAGTLQINTMNNPEELELQTGEAELEEEMTPSQLVDHIKQQGRVPSIQLQTFTTQPPIIDPKNTKGPSFQSPTLDLNGNNPEGVLTVPLRQIDPGNEAPETLGDLLNEGDPETVEMESVPGSGVVTVRFSKPRPISEVIVDLTPGNFPTVTVHTLPKITTVPDEETLRRAAETFGYVLYPADEEPEE